MQGILKGVKQLLTATGVLLVLLAASILGFIAMAFVSVIHFIGLGLALLTVLAYCIWEAFNKPQDTNE